jgi:hypothetical protein
VVAWRGDNYARGWRMARPRRPPGSPGSMYPACRSEGGQGDLFSGAAELRRFMGLPGSARASPIASYSRLDLSEQADSVKETTPNSVLLHPGSGAVAGCFCGCTPSRREQAWICGMGTASRRGWNA